jgi:hypothetical protein
LGHRLRLGHRRLRRDAQVSALSRPRPCCRLTHPSRPRVAPHQHGAAVASLSSLSLPLCALPSATPESILVTPVSILVTPVLDTAAALHSALLLYSSDLPSIGLRHLLAKRTCAGEAQKKTKKNRASIERQKHQQGEDRESGTVEQPEERPARRAGEKQSDRESTRSDAPRSRSRRPSRSLADRPGRRRRSGTVVAAACPVRRQ